MIRSTRVTLIIREYGGQGIICRVKRIGMSNPPSPDASPIILHIKFSFRQVVSIFRSHCLGNKILIFTILLLLPLYLLTFRCVWLFAMDRTHHQSRKIQYARNNANACYANLNCITSWLRISPSKSLTKVNSIHCVCNYYENWIISYQTLKSDLNQLQNMASGNHIRTPLKLNDIISIYE